MKNANSFFLERLQNIGRRNFFDEPVATPADSYSPPLFSEAFCGQWGPTQKMAKQAGAQPFAGRQRFWAFMALFAICLSFPLEGQINPAPLQMPCCSVPESKLLTEQEQSFFDTASFYLSGYDGTLYQPQELEVLSDPDCATANDVFHLHFGPGFTQEEETTICQVFEGLSQAIVSQNQGLDIRVLKEDIDALGQGGAVYADGTNFSRCGVESNMLWEYINSPSPSYNLPGEPADFFLATLRIDVGLPVNEATGAPFTWHTLSQDTPSFDDPNISGGAFDLYSVTLHEALHMLGFHSRIEASGAPRGGFYSRWDKFLAAGLINTHLSFFASNAPPCELLVSSCPGDLTSGGFYCMEQSPDGTPINIIVTEADITNPEEWHPYAFQWRNESSETIQYIFIDIDDNSGGLRLDNLHITAECENEVSVTPTIEEACVGGQIQITYEVCLIGAATGPSEVSLHLELPDIPGLSIAGGE